MRELFPLTFEFHVSRDAALRRFQRLRPGYADKLIARSAQERRLQNCSKRPEQVIESMQPPPSQLLYFYI